MSKADESRYMGLVAQLPCACCGMPGVHVHHLREEQGMAQRASNYMVIPLCPDCHVGKNGVHGDKTYMRIKKLTELDMLADTIGKIFAGKRFL